MKFFYRSFLIAALISSCLSGPSFSYFYSDDEEATDHIEKKRLQKQENLLQNPTNEKDPAEIFPLERLVNILSRLDQFDLLKTGAVSQPWRAATRKVWETREFGFPNA